MDDGSEANEDEHQYLDLLFESISLAELKTTLQERMMQSKNPAEIEKREAIISAYCTVREAVEIEVEKYNLLGY